MKKGPLYWSFFVGLTDTERFPQLFDAMGSSLQELAQLLVLFMCQKLRDSILTFRLLFVRSCIVDSTASIHTNPEGNLLGKHCTEYIVKQYVYF